MIEKSSGHIGKKDVTFQFIACTDNEGVSRFSLTCMVLATWTQQYQISFMETQCVILILYFKVKVFNSENCLLLTTVYLF